MSFQYLANNWVLTRTEKDLVLSSKYEYEWIDNYLIARNSNLFTAQTM